jgi:hypothetical protein
MTNPNSLFLFVFIFSLLVIIRTIFNFISSLYQNPPQKLFLNYGELIFLGLSISYIITYLIKI